MPNWCQNILYLSHKDEALRTRAFRALDRNEFLSVMVPVTEDSRESRIESWGTKWDVREIDVFEINEPDQTIELQFDTAWSPPLGVYEALMDKGFYIRAEYVDEGVGFAGEWIDGDDFCYGSKEDTPEHLSHLWPTYDEDDAA